MDADVVPKYQRTCLVLGGYTRNTPKDVIEASIREIITGNEGLQKHRHFYCPWGRSSYGWVFFETSEDLRTFQREFKQLDLTYTDPRTDTANKLW